MFALLWGVLNVSGLMVAKPEDVQQTWLALLTACVGVLSQAAIIGSVTTILQRINMQKNAERVQHEATMTYLRSKGVPENLQRRIRDFYDFAGGFTQGGARDDELLPCLPKLLRFQVEIFKK